MMQPDAKVEKVYLYPKPTCNGCSANQTCGVKRSDRTRTCLTFLTFFTEWRVTFQGVDLRRGQSRPSLITVLIAVNFFAL
ncbi:hypothetical protein AO386_17640 [Pseudomonas syringae ICMP 11292]|nr:hypothetical protein AO386_17640 [Pseudomonas syringae ICMP 11292]